MTARTCPACGYENDPDQRFCLSCGHELIVICLQCEQANPSGSRFCGNCGSPLKAAPAPSLAEERRLVTVIFADISGFTDHARERDPEEVSTMVDACMAMLGEVVERYGGTVDKVIGDALMAVFGAPVAHEDDPDRAVRAALEMKACAVENAEQFANLLLRIGVNTGEVMFAPVGPGSGRAFTVMGDTVNIAQRLQAAAPKGGVLVGEDTRRMASAAMRFGEPVTAKVKETEEPVIGWPALEAAAIPVERPLSTVQMVGREQELTRLRNMWRQASGELRPQLVTVFGPPGIGKTRIARELVDLIEAEGGRGVRGRSVPYGEKSGYAAFAQQLRAIAGIFATDSTQDARTKLDLAVAELVEFDAGVIATHLAVLTGLGGEGSISDRDVTFLSARRFVEAIGRERPTALVFEDIHWAAESLLDLVEYLAEKVRDVPILFLALARPELRDRRPNWGGGLESFSSFRLEPLTEEASVELATQLLSVHELDAAEELARRAEGNPLFVEELVASLGGQQHAVAALPTNIKGIIASRIDALPPGERSLILDASVIGKTFWRGALEYLRSADDALGELLESLERRDLVRREASSRLEGDEEFTFKHMLIRDVAYETLPKAARRDRHAAVARFIEKATGDRVAESAVTLAHHWRLAEEVEKAISYLLEAAELARRSGARTEAVSLLDSALELLPDAEVDRRRSVRLQRATILVELGELEKGAQALDQLLDELEGTERFEALRARTLAANWQMQAKESRIFGERAVEVAEQVGRDELKAVALGLRAFGAAMEGRCEEAIEFDEQALDLWPDEEFEPQRSEVLAWAAVHRYWIGEYEQAVKHSRAAYELGKSVSSVNGLVVGGSHVGLGLTGLGRHEEALRVLQQTLREAREIEMTPIFTSRLQNILAGTHHELYETNEARRINEDAIESGNRAAFSAAVMSGEIDLLFSDLFLGEVGRAELAWPRLWETAGASKGWHQWLWTMRLASAKAEIELAAGRFEAAENASRQGIEHAARFRRPKYIATTRLTLGAALLRQGRGNEAAAETQRALAEAQALAHPPSIWRAAASLGRLLVAIGEDEEAELAFTQARATLVQFADALSPERRERFLTAPVVDEMLVSTR